MVDKETLCYAHLTDLHLRSSDDIVFLEELMQYFDEQSDKYAFLICSGDLTDTPDLRLLQAIKSIFDQAKLPVHVIPGNHDIWEDESPTIYEFETIFGTSNYVINKNGVQLLCLNSVGFPQDVQELFPYYEQAIEQNISFHNACFTQQTMDQFERLVKDLDPTLPLIVISHHAWSGGHNDWVLKQATLNAQALDKLFEHYNLIGVFNGHAHSTLQYYYQGVQHWCLPRLSPFKHNNDGSPMGYAEISCSDQKLQCKINQRHIQGAQ